MKRNPWNLTDRQSQVMDALVEDGCCNKLIGRKLGLTQGTVEQHTIDIYKRMSLHSRVMAALAWDRWKREQAAMEVQQ